MNKIVVLTGAGMSAESGLSTFRDSGGLWEQYRIEEVATPEAFKKNPYAVYIRYFGNGKNPYPVDIQVDYCPMYDPN